jgi:hypothetical protein
VVVLLRERLLVAGAVAIEKSLTVRVTMQLSATLENSFCTV